MNHRMRRASIFANPTKNGKLLEIVGVLFFLMLVSCQTAPNQRQETNSNTPGENFMIGYRATDSKDYDQAIKFFKIAISQDETGDCGTGTPGKAYNELGYAYMLRGDFDSAYHNFNAAIEKNEYLISAYTNRNNYFEKNGMYSDEVSGMTKIIDISEPSPKIAPCYFARGHAYQMMGNKVLAVEDFRTFLSLLEGTTGWEALRNNAKQQIEKLSEK